MKKLRLFAGIGLVVVLVGGALLVFQRVSAEPGCDGKWPCMLYFYADW